MAALDDPISPAAYTPGILPDSEIRRLAMNNGMIKPYVDSCVDKGKISYGLSSFGYDVRLAPEFKIFRQVKENQGDVTVPDIIDPKAFDSAFVEDYTGEVCIIPPHGFVLGRTLETVLIPRDLLVICMAKSTYARVGLVVGVTPIEPEFEGTVTLELSNTTDFPVKVYAKEGICQFMFFRGAGPCETSYAERGGKYMGQRSVTTSRIKE